MALIAVPDGLGFAEAEWTLETPFSDNRSGWTGARRGAGLPGAAHWTAALEFAGVGLGHTAAAPVRAFLASLRGSINSFRVPVARNQHGLAAAAKVKSGASGGLVTMTLKNLPASTTLLGAGYYISVIRSNGKAQMLLLTAPLTANAAGEAIATFEPPLIQSLATDSAVETRNPFCEVTLTRSRVGWKQGRNTSHSFNSIEVEEVV